MYEQIDLAALVNAAGDSIIAVASDGKIISWNPAAGRVSGFTAAEALGQPLDLIIPECFRQRHWEGFDLVTRTGRPPTAPMCSASRLCTKTGARFPSPSPSH